MASNQLYDTPWSRRWSLGTGFCPYSVWCDQGLQNWGLELPLVAFLHNQVDGQEITSLAR